MPLLTSPAVAAGVVWAYDRTWVWPVLRQDVTLDVDASRYVESDLSTMRVGFGFGHPQSVVRITAA